ncbi:MAG: metal ABC transporter permease [Pseudoruegeria sp.]
MFDDFLIRALCAGIGVSLAAGPLGAFVVWRRMAYFGDATAHAAILGVAISLGFSTSIYVGTVLTAVGMGLSISALSARGHAIETSLGVLSHSALALGLVAVSFLSGVRVDLSAFLFGDILAVSKTDLWVIWGGAAMVLALLTWRWQPLLTSTLSPDLAQSSGINPQREQLVLTLALAIVVAVALKVVGALLITAMLLIPAASARNLSRTPEHMAIMAVVLGILASCGGLGMSLYADTPAGPSIVLAAGVLFLLTLGIKRRV